jgi:HPt (histidine-containing phosphotransfer) domain-containing protein
MDDYLTKPIEPAALIQAMAKALQHSLLPRDEAPRITTTAPETLYAAGPNPLIPLDWTSLVTRCMGNTALAQATAKRFVSRAPEVLQQVREAVAVNDRAQARQLLHHLKGMASNVSAQEVADAVAELEAGAAHDAREDLAAGVEAVHALIDRVVAAVSLDQSQLDRVAAAQDLTFPGAFEATSLRELVETAK